MENQTGKILSFEEFLNRNNGTEIGQEAPAEVSALPAHDNDPIGDTPVETDMELVSGEPAEVEPVGGDEAEAELPAEEEVDKPADEMPETDLPA